MLQTELPVIYIELLVQDFGVIFTLGVLFWFGIHFLYDRGHLGSWPPSQRIVRILVWMLILFPIMTLLLFGGSLLLISALIPPLEPQLMMLFEHLDLLDYVALIVFASLIFFRVLRWTWNGYGTTGVILLISISFCIDLFLISLNLISSSSVGVFEFGQLGWRGMSLYTFCCFRDFMKPKSNKEPEVFVLQGHTSIELTTKKIYSIVVPLVRRIKIDHDESAMELLKGFLVMNSGFERVLTLACKALGFDRMEFLSESNVEDASELLQNVPSEWGNFSKTDFVALFLVTSLWIVMGVISLWAYLNEALKQNLIPFFLFFFLPIGVLGVLSITNTHKPSKEYTIAKRHDEFYGFTQREYKKRVNLDVALLVTALVGTVFVGYVTFVIQGPLLDFTILVVLSVLFILTIVLTKYDGFLHGNLPSDDETLRRLRKQLQDKIPPPDEEDDEP